MTHAVAYCANRAADWNSLAECKHGPAVARIERRAALKCMHYRHISGAWKSTPHGDVGLLLLCGMAGFVTSVLWL